MEWQFWKPRHTVASVAEQLARDLSTGAVDLDDPLLDGAAEECQNVRGLILEIDVPTNLPDEDLLDIVKGFTRTADEDCRLQGGEGLTICLVTITGSAVRKEVRVALRAKALSTDVHALEAVAVNLRKQPRAQSVELLDVRAVS